MKYIAKAKDANRFKTIDDISEFEVKDFEKYELYEVRPIESDGYENLLKQKKIELLTGQLKELGIDLSALSQQRQPSIQTQTFTESPFLVEDRADASVPVSSSSSGMSKVEKPNTDVNYTMDELRSVFEKFKEQVEKDIPEISWSQLDENGITLFMTEKVNSLPNRLPNGIPIIQRDA